MIFWIDAQLPPALAGWLAAQFSLEAVNLESLGLRQAQDIDIFQHARRPGHVIMTKDDDFVDIVTRLGTTADSVGHVRERYQSGLAGVIDTKLSGCTSAAGGWRTRG